jgi:predicted dienelactone hydrolase
MSHGSGSAYFAHYDTALALAQAGFVVAALTHPGDNSRDESKFIEAPVNRPREVSRLLDYMLAAWPEHHHQPAYKRSNDGALVALKR